MLYLNFRLYALIGIVFSGVTLHVHATDFPSAEGWVPHLNDRMLVDVQQNIGYLVHVDGRSLAFPVATGQRRTVRFIGMTYYAGTPERSWSVKSIDLKDDHTTFGPTGRFLRLYTDDGSSTNYGIHSHSSADEFLESGNRYRSMGCIIVSEQMLNIIEQTYMLNGGSLRLLTSHKVALQ